MTTRLEELLEEVELSSPAQNAFTRAISAGYFDEAHAILFDEGLDEEDIQLLIEYFDNKNKTNITLVEVEVSDIAFSETEDDDFYLFRYGQNLVRASLYERRGVLTFYCDSEFVPVKNAHQAWLIVKTD